MERKIEITYNWWRIGKTGKTHNILPRHTDFLEESAMERISEKMKEGYTSGELYDNIRSDDRDGQDGTEYRGHWEIKIQK